MQQRKVKDAVAIGLAWHGLRVASGMQRYVADTVAPQIRRCDIDGVTRPPELVPETLRWMAGVYLAQAQQVRVAETIVKEENAYITTKGT